MLADGKIAYNVKIEDEYKLNRVAFNMDKDGNFYITPKRPVIKTKEVSTVPEFRDMYYTFGDFLKTVS